MSNTPKVPSVPKINVPDFRRLTAIEAIAERVRGTALDFVIDMPGIDCPVPDGVTIPPLLEITSPAEMMYKKLVKQIIEFESKLLPEEEIGGRVIAAPRDGVMHITDIQYQEDDLLIFHGTDPDGRPTQILQHYSQVNVQLCALPKEKEQPRRIGFILHERIK